MDINNITKAKKYKKEIDDLDYFIKNINGRWSQTKMLLKIKRSVKYSIFGSRYFGGGSHEQIIKVPSRVIDKVTSEAIMWKKELEERIKEL